MTIGSSGAARAPLAFALLFLPACLVPKIDSGAVVRGPLPTRIQQPVALLFPGPAPRTAAVLGGGEARASLDVWYSSIYERRVTPGAEANFDGEIARAEVRLAYGVGHGSEIVLQPAALFATGGFLDRIVDEFHSVTGFEGGGRRRADRDQYSMRLVSGGVTAYSLEEDEVLFADLPVTWVKALRVEDESGPAVASRVTIELPTGDEQRGAGSGGIDASIGLLVERSVGRWTLTGGVDGVFVDQPDAFEAADIQIRKLLFVAGGVEYRWSDRLSLLGQVLFQSPLTRDVPFEEIDREILDLGFGIARELGDGTRLRISFHEDVVAATGPDVTLYAGLELNW